MTFKSFVKLVKLSILMALIAMPLTYKTIGVDAEPPVGSPAQSVCKANSLEEVKCHAKVVLNGKTGKPNATTSYSSGLSPADLQSAYKLPALPAPNTVFSSNGQTVAIVDAYDSPNVASDLLAYRKQFNLPLCAYGSGLTVDAQIGCLFTKVNQSGSTTSLPVADLGWAQEINLDTQMVSATCPRCKILLVEANSNAYSDLLVAVDRAYAMGANAISNSWGSGEWIGETNLDINGHFNHPGVAITASSGDNGYGATYPAASQYVTAVGGTKLVKSTTTRGWTETAWSGAGSGCSQYIVKPTWQPVLGTCGNRIVSDVSAVADPNTGVAVYISYGSYNGANWYVFGGTSVAAPIVASVYALAGNSGGASPAIKYGEYPYAHKTGLFDVVSGTNGICGNTKKTKSDIALCTAVTGFDGPTGLGSPNGITGF